MPVAAQARGACAEAASLTSEAAAFGEPVGDAHAQHASPDIPSPASFGLLVQHGLVPMENRSPREALRLYADHVARENCSVVTKQACTMTPAMH